MYETERFYSNRRQRRMHDPHAVSVGVDCSDADPAKWTVFGINADQAQGLIDQARGIAPSNQTPPRPRGTSSSESKP